MSDMYCSMFDSSIDIRNIRLVRVMLGTDSAQYRTGRQKVREKNAVAETMSTRFTDAPIGAVPKEFEKQNIQNVSSLNNHESIFFSPEFDMGRPIR